MSRCGSTDTTTGEPCGFPSDGNCPHHSQGLQGPQQRAARLLRSGDYTRKEVAQQCGVDQSTLWRWRQKHPELEEAAKEGDRTQYVEVVDSWIERLKSGDHSAAEIIFYLKNKSRVLEGESWRDTKEHKHSGSIEGGGDVNIYLPSNDRDQLPRPVARRMEAASGNGAGEQ